MWKNWSAKPGAGPAAELPSKLFQQYGDQVGEMLAVHVTPHELLLDKGVLRGKSWQTKTERGTPFAVPDSAVKHHGWLQKGWKNFTEQFPGERDFWIPNFTAKSGRLEFFEGQTPELGPDH